MSVQVPAVFSVNEQEPAPAERVPEQVTVVALSVAVTVTEPVGVPPVPVTLKLTETDWPTVEGFGELAVMVVVEAALVAVVVVTTCGAALKLVLPA